MIASHPSPQLRLWARFWRLPALTVARFTLKSYVKSGWILLDIVLIWLFYATFFLEFGGDVSYFFATTNMCMSGLTLLSTIIIIRRAMQARVYLPLARLSSRSAYIRGIILATGILRIPQIFLMLLLCGGYHTHIPIFGITGATIGSILAGLLGQLLIMAIIGALTTILSTPIATRYIQMLFLCWLIIILYPNTNPLLAPFFTLLKLPLLPLIACYNLSLTGIGWYELLMLILAVGYSVGLTMLADFWLSRRDLIFY